MKMGFSDRLFGVVSFVTVSVIALLCLLPFWLMLTGSITSERELLFEGYKLFPEKISFIAYKVLFLSDTVYKSYGVTTFITVVGTTMALLFTSMLSYSIANRKNRFRNILAFSVYFTMLFNGGMVPLYILVSNWLNLSNSIWALILPLLVNPFFVFIMVTFFRALPEEIAESGRMDGANEMMIFFLLIVPISTPSLATIGLFYALIYWNDWFYALLFISEEDKFPLQLLLRRLVSNMEAAKSLVPSGSSITVEVPSLQVRMATTAITIGPIILLYPFIQKYFVRGLTIGSIKG